MSKYFLRSGVFCMLEIRNEQMKSFAQAALHQFEDEMLVHLGGFSPPLVKTLSDSQLRAVVRLGISQAQQYGFTLRGPVRFYLELMLLFGSYFDNDPQYAWAHEILSDTEGGSEMQRAERLYEKTLDYRREVGGPDDEYAIKALRNISWFAGQPLSIAPDNFIAALERELMLIYPQKAQYIGEAALRALIQKGIEGAQRQRFSSVRSVVLVCVLMLAFGHGCGADPLYPWIKRTLEDETLREPEAKAQRLEKRALTWLNQVLVNFNSDKADDLPKQ